MIEYTASDIIDSAIDGNAVKIQDIVNDMMKERTAEVLATKKIEVAKSFFNPEE